MLEAKEIDLERGNRAVALENDHVLVTVLPQKGCQISTNRLHKESGVDVLWKDHPGDCAARGVAFRPRATPDFPGWSTTLVAGKCFSPSGGGPCTYKGVELSYHTGKHRLSPGTLPAWDIPKTKPGCEPLRLARSPFTLTREMVLPKKGQSFLLRETIRNDAGEPMDYMWGHHPAYGAPFLSGDCRIDTNTTVMQADPSSDPAGSVMEQGAAVWLAECRTRRDRYRSHQCARRRRTPGIHGLPR